MSLVKDLDELVRAHLIDQETSGKIHLYYAQKKGKSTSRLITIFSILGALLVGLGIILIIAHNWDQINKSIRTGLAFLPLVAGQTMALYAMIKKSNSDAWRESTAVFLILAVAASISLVAQIYQIYGDLGRFLLTWSLLSLPLIYAMRSNLASIICVVILTWFAAQTGYTWHPGNRYLLYWPLLAIILPHYYQLLRSQPSGNFTVYHNWLLPISLTITLGTLAQSNEELMFFAYLCLFGLFLQIGNATSLKNQPAFNNGYLVLGIMGTFGLLLALTFRDFWDYVLSHIDGIGEMKSYTEMIILLILLSGTLILSIPRWKKTSLFHINPFEPVYLLTILVWLLKDIPVLAIIVTNLLVLAIGIIVLLKGHQTNHLGVMNFGLIVVTALIICRFFDTDLSFTVRGLLFILVGSGFFIANYRFIKKRKQTPSGSDPDHDNQLI